MNENFPQNKFTVQYKALKLTAQRPSEVIEFHI